MATPSIRFPLVYQGSEQVFPLDTASFKACADYPRRIQASNQYLSYLISRNSGSGHPLISKKCSNCGFFSLFLYQNLKIISSLSFSNNRAFVTSKAARSRSHRILLLYSALAVFQHAKLAAKSFWHDLRFLEHFNGQNMPKPLRKMKKIYKYM
jgi:hypothetical protein